MKYVFILNATDRLISAKVFKAVYIRQPFSFAYFLVAYKSKMFLFTMAVPNSDYSM